MCRWAAYTGAPIFLEEIVSRPGHSLIHQSHCATQCHTAINADGFGIAWYGARPEPGLFRDVLPAWSDPNLKSLTAQVQSHLFLAHVRASTGTATSRNNCHPFTHGRWSFMHNGQVGGYDCLPVAGEITYGLERLAMYVQGKDSIYDLAYNDAGVTYGDVFLAQEQQFSAFNFEHANTEKLFEHFRDAAAECNALVACGLPLPAYDQAIKASHFFNLLNARGVISVAERQAYIGRVRDLTKAVCTAQIEKHRARWQAQFPEWAA